MSPALTVLGFVVAAGATALARSLVIEALNSPLFPWGTLAVNTAGALVAGVVAARAPEAWMTLLGTAALGAFTTFSTFAVELDTMVDERRLLPAASYAAATVVLAVGAAVVGLGI